jgi:arginase
MGLAILAGEAFRGIRASVPGFRAVPGTRVLLLGARQVSDGEHALMRRVGTTYLSVGQLRAGALAPALEGLAAAGVRTLYIHVDLDVIDPSIAPANVFAEPDGLFPDELAAGIRQAAARFPVAGAGLASYDPSCDREDRMLGVGLDLIEMLPGRR